MIEKILEENDEQYLKDTVERVINKIKLLPFGKITTLAILENYDPEKLFVNPSMQGKIFKEVELACKNNNINFERVYDDNRGGLAYHYEFKKTL